MTGAASRLIDITGRIRLAFTRQSVVVEPGVAAAVPRSEEIEFVAYAEDCILSGHLRMAADRVSDLLNENEEFELVDVLVDTLDGAPSFEVHELVVHRDELLIVHATGPRGNAERRRRTRQHPIVAKVGPYVITGYVHALPGTDPIASLRHRKPMIALTDAVFDYSVGTIHEQRRAAVAILNRDCVDWIAEGRDADQERLDMPVDDSGPLLKDFTGDLLT